MAEDLYAALGVSKNADAAAIKKAYRALARDLHPDKNPGNAQVEARFKRVNQAFQTLSDPQKRALYDEFGDDALREGFDAERARQVRAWANRGGGVRGGQGGVSLEDLFGGGFAGGNGVHVDFGSVDSNPFGDMFGGGRRVRRPAKGQDLESSLRVSFVDAARGTTLTMAPQGTSITVRIPPGASEGSRLRIAGQGMPSTSGGPPGDLFLVVHVDPHPHYRREDDDLHVDLPVTLGEAYFGAKVKVPTLDGSVMLKVPAGTQSGATLRVPGKGIARKNKTPGNLYVHLLVQIPTQHDAETDQLIEQLASKDTSDPREKITL